MTTSKKRINLILWSSAGIVTNFMYLIIFILLLQSPNVTSEPERAIELTVSLIALSIFLSLIIILKGLKEEKSVEWGLIRLAILQIPALTGFIIGLTMILN